MTFLGLDDLAGIEDAHGLVRETGYSSPVPRFVGRVLVHDETVALSRKP